MSNPSTIHDSNTDLQALGRKYQAETERVRKHEGEADHE